jgi:hypothetical protein
VAKSSGLGANLYVDGYDLSNDTGSVQRIGGGPVALDLTGINKSAFERVGGQRDGAIDFTSWHNSSAGQAHPVLSALPSVDRIVSYYHSTTLGDPAASIVCKQVDYSGTRAQDGSLSYSVPNPSNGYALEWGVSLTAGKRTDTGATAGTAVDFAAGTNFGLQAYLHVFSFSGTDATITIQESSDNSGDAYANVVGGGFTQITSAPTKQRIATATNLAVERYLKVTTTTATSFTSLVFAVMVVRNEAAPAF